MTIRQLVLCLAKDGGYAKDKNKFNDSASLKWATDHKAVVASMVATNKGKKNKRNCKSRTRHRKVSEIRRISADAAAHDTLPRMGLERSMIYEIHLAISMVRNMLL